MRNILFVVIALLLLVSCKENTIQGDSIVEIKLDDAKTTSLMTEDIFESVRYIPLRNIDDVLISRIKKIKIIDDLIYLFDDRQETIFIFDLDGNCLKKFNKKGRGNGEYVSSTDFEVDDKYIYVGARVPKGVLRYDKQSFRFVDILGEDIMPYRIVCNSNSLFVYTGNSANVKMKDVNVLDKHTGKIIGQYKDLTQGKTGWVSSATYLTNHDDKVYGFFNSDYNIYQFQNDNYKPILSLDFGKNNMLPKEVADFSSDEYDNYFKTLPDPFDRPVRGIDDLYITDKHIYFSFVYLKQNNFVIYSPESKKVSFGRIDGTDNMPITGNLLYVTENDEVIMYREAYSLLSSLEYIREYNKEFTIPEELSNITPEDNPILIIYKMKP